MSKKAKARKSTPKRQQSKSRHRAPRVERTSLLPGMEDARIKVLDDVAAALSDIRAQRNTLAADEKANLQTALKEMHRNKKTVWSHAGIELVLVPGDERVRARLVRGGGNVEVSTGDGE